MVYLISFLILGKSLALDLSKVSVKMIELEPNIIVAKGLCSDSNSKYLSHVGDREALRVECKRKNALLTSFIGNRDYDRILESSIDGLCRLNFGEGYHYAGAVEDLRNPQKPSVTVLCNPNK